MRTLRDSGSSVSNYTFPGRLLSQSLQIRLLQQPNKSPRIWHRRKCPAQMINEQSCLRYRSRYGGRGKCHQAEIRGMWSLPLYMVYVFCVFVPSILAAVPLLKARRALHFAVYLED